MSTVVVVQARTGSSRFPGKVLADLGGQTMLGFMLDRIHTLGEDRDTCVVVATSDAPPDDEVARIGRSKGIAVVRGSEEDVLARFGRALDEHPADTVVRLTADCPLMDPDLVRAVLAAHHATGADYTSNTLARTFPDGLDVEVMAAGILRWADEQAQRPDEREHVTPFLQRHPRQVQIHQLLDDAEAGDERWTVDRREDLDTIRAAVDAAPDALTTSWQAILDLLGRRAIKVPVLVPLPTRPHQRGEPYHRAWAVTDRSEPAGSAFVVVDDGGIGQLKVTGARPDLVAEAVKGHLRADLQVTELTTIGAHTT